MEDKKGILLESGTNEFEIIEFSVGGVFYGLNVAKSEKSSILSRLLSSPNRIPTWTGYSHCAPASCRWSIWLAA